MNQLFDRFIAAAALNLIQSLYRALKAERNFFFFFFYLRRKKKDRLSHDAFREKPPFFNVRAQIGREIMRRKGAQCNTKD